VSDESPSGASQGAVARDEDRAGGETVSARSTRARPLTVVAGALMIALLLGPGPESNPLGRLRTGIAEPTVEMLTHQMKAWHYRPYHVLSELAPRADYLFLMDESVSGKARRNARTEELIAIAGAASVRTGEGSFVPPTDFPADAHTIRDQNPSGEWAVIVADGPPPALMLVVNDPTSSAAVLYLDQRLAGEAGESVRATSSETRLRRDRVGDRPHLGNFIPAAWAESILLLLVLIGGSLLIPRGHFSAWVVPSAGMIAGSALLVVVGTGSFALGLPGSPGLLLVLSAGIAGFTASRRSANRAEARARSPSLTRWALLAGAPSVAIIALMSAVLHADGIVTQQRDGVEHIVRGVVLARGGSVEVLQDLRTLNLRMAGLASVHGLGSLWGAELLMAWGAVLALATVVLTATAIRRLTQPVVGGPMSALLGVGGAVLLCSLPMFLYAGLSHLPHIPIAALATLLFVLLLPRCSKSAVEDGVRHEGHLFGLLAMALVLVKPDGLFVAALLLLGVRHVDRVTAVVAWRYLGLAIVGWQAIMLRAAILSGTVPSRDVLVQALVGSMLLAFSGVLLRLPRRTYALLTAAPLAVIGCALALVAVTGQIDGSLVALRANILRADGGWGSALAVLLVAAIAASVAAVIARSESLRPLVLSVLGLPAIFLLIPIVTESRGSGYRVGLSDSMNRMWVNILPLVIILVVAALAALRRQSPSPEVPGGPPSGGHESVPGPRAPIAGPMAAAVATLGMLVVAVALPSLPLAERGPEVLVFTGSVDDRHLIGEITSNVEVITRLEFAGLAPISPALHDGRLCLGLLPYNFADRANSGSYTVELRIAGRSEWWLVDMADEPDGVPTTHCLERLRPRDLDALLRDDDTSLTISGASGQRGTSSTLAFTPGGSVGSVLQASGLAEPIPDGYIPHLEVFVETAGGLRWASALRMTALVSMLALLVGAWESRRARARSVPDHADVP
jgi:hypothetical protein